MNIDRILENYSSSEYYDAIAHHGEDDADLVYYLIKMRLRKALMKVFLYYGDEVYDNFDESIDDFFIYLHDGFGGGAPSPFAMIDNITDKKTLFSWIKNTYRIFLLNKYRNYLKLPVFQGLPPNYPGEGREDFDELEEKIVILCTAIAYSDQQFSLLMRFVFFKYLLTIIDKPRSITQEKMSTAIGLRPNSYRIASKRQKDLFLFYVKLLRRGLSLPLDKEHETMRDQLISDFGHLYDILLSYYDAILEKLPCRDAVKALREDESNRNGLLMHETPPLYGDKGRASMIELFQIINSEE